MSIKANSTNFALDRLPPGEYDIEFEKPLYKTSKYITGFEVTAREVKVGGERIWNLEKLLNVRQGFTAEDDTFCGTELLNIDNPMKLRSGERYLMDWLDRRVTKKDLDQMLVDYYDERGWDADKGIPTPAKLAELGLEAYIPIVQGMLER